MELIRTKHFQSWLENTFVKLAGAYKSIEENRARIMFKDEFYNDANMLSFILNGTYPNTRREEDDYLFVTKDDFIHTDIKTGEVWRPGAMTFRLVDIHPKIFFENKAFRHGQVRTDGTIKCWGGFIPFGAAFTEIGLSGSLMDMYNFARVSDHDTRMEVTRV